MSLFSENMKFPTHPSHRNLSTHTRDYIHKRSDSDPIGSDMISPTNFC